MIGFELIVFMKGLSYADIANQIGMSRQGVNIWIKRESIPNDKLEMLSEILNCPKYYLTAKVDINKLENDLQKYLEI